MTQKRHSLTVRPSLLAAAPLVAGSLLLTGCSGASDSSADKKEFSLSYAVFSTTDNAFGTLAKKYMEEHPDVTVTLNGVPSETYPQTLTTQLQGGNASDVSQTAPGLGQGNSVISLAKAGLLEPLDDTATELIPAGNGPLLQDGDKTYGLPMSISYVGGLLNQTAAESAGIEYPTDWNSLLAACSKATSQGKSLFAVAGAAPPNAGITALTIAATRVYAENPEWNEQRAEGKTKFATTDGWRDTLQAILDLKNGGCFQAGAEGVGIDALGPALGSGKALAAFGPGGTTADLAKQVPQAKFAVTPFPAATSSDKSYGLVSSNYSLSVAASSLRKEAANEFLDWAAQPEQLKEFADAQGSLPVTGYETVDFSATPYAAVADQIKQQNFVALPNATWPNQSVYDALGSGVQGLLTGQRSVDDVLQAMDAAWG